MQQSNEAVVSRRLIIALGGNAIIPAGRKGTFDEQVQVTRSSMEQVASLAADGHQLVLTHGNGPVVGNIVLRCEAGMATHGIPPMPLHVCGADSQGGIGYMLQQSLQNSLRARNLQRPVASLVTQVIVSEDDPAFQMPTKPIGPFYSAEQANRLRQENGWSIVEDANRGYRRVVPSPQPQKVVEWEAIKAMTKAGIITIAAGGGGIPVTCDKRGQLQGIDAVIDKDRASALLGKLINADTFVIITSVDQVYLDFGKPNARPVTELDSATAARYLEAGEFPPGSMGPKIESALAFLAGGGSEVIITGPDTILDALQGKAGTRIVTTTASG